MNLFEIMAHNFRVLFSDRVGRPPTDDEITEFCSRPMKADELLSWFEAKKKTESTQDG